MEVRVHQSFAVAESSQPVAVRLAARALALNASFSDADVHRAGLVATEMATNLVKHATGGEMLMRRIGGRSPGVELIAIDKGPGISNVAEALIDGRSTAGSPGTGLGAIQRMSDEFDLYSQRGTGSVLFVRLRQRPTPPLDSTAYDIGVVAVSKPGEEVSGDAWYACEYRSALLAVVADGLGHGPFAHEAAAAAIGALDPRSYRTPAATLEAMHQGSRHTRGAAAAVAELDPDAGIVKYAGVGNISGSICREGSSRQAVSQNGTLGHEARYFRDNSYPWNNTSLLIMHSDGLSARWSLDSYPGLASRHPVIIASVLYRDCSRRRDDVTVLVAREAARSPRFP